MTPQSHLHLLVWQSMDFVNHRFCARSATEGSVTIGLRGALGVEITHQTVNVDLHSGCFWLHTGTGHHPSCPYPWALMMIAVLMLESTPV